MDCGKFILTGLRVVQIVLAAAVIGLGSWGELLSNTGKASESEMLMVEQVTHTIHDIEIRGDVILRTTTPLDPCQRDAWTTFFSILTGSQTRIWIAIAGVGSHTFP